MTQGRNETQFQGSFKHDSTSCSSVFMLIYSFRSAVKRRHNYTLTPLAFRAEETNFLFSLSDSRQRASVFTGLTSCPVQTEENQQTSSRCVPRGDFTFQLSGPKSRRFWLVHFKPLEPVCPQQKLSAFGS